jgi:hypothetical protein
MSKHPEGNVVPLRSTHTLDSMAPVHAAALLVPAHAQPRETSWRDLVRRLAKKPAKR